MPGLFEELMIFNDLSLFKMKVDGITESIGVKRLK
jgi:hypothetical protein